MSALARKLKQAQDALQRGDVATAQSLCNEVLRTAPRNPEGLYLHALIELMSGRPQAAIAPLEQVIAHAPRHGPALENLGLALLMAGEYARAEPVLKTAAALPGAPASVDMRLGLALLHDGRPAEAIGWLTKAHDKDGRDPLILINLGQAHARSGNAAAARSALEHALAVAPDHPDALYNLGVLELDAEALETAQRYFLRALRQSPEHVDALVNLSVVERRRGAPAEGLQRVERALRIDPGSAAAWDNAGLCLTELGRLMEGRNAFLKAITLDERRISAREGMAAVCFRLARYREAVPHLQTVIDQEPANARARTALANAWFQTGDLARAETTAQEALQADPNSGHAYDLLAELKIVNGELAAAIEALEKGYAETREPMLLGKLCHQLRRACDWRRWQQVWVELHPYLSSNTAVASPFALLSEPTTAAEQLDYARRWCAERFPAASHGSSPSPRREGRLRIGYLSSDFYEHATAYLLAEVFELHDRERFEVFAYSYGPDDQSPMRARLMAACEHFVDIAFDPDDVAIEKIRRDELDVLIDLKGYTMGSRTGILAGRPCPIQVSWVGYPGTMGAPFIDYLLADEHVIPADKERHYSERILRLPHCYQPNDRQRPIAVPLSRAEYGLPDDSVVLCCFNQSYKITPDIFGVWMEALKAQPQAVLWLLEDNALAVKNLRRATEQAGVAPERLVFAPKRPLAEHLARYRVADLALDTFPYTSHTTASDALWAGCPLIGIRGETFAARVSASILLSAGLADYVTEDTEDYRQRLIAMVNDPAQLGAGRQRVEAASTSALFDAVSFTRDLEQILAGLSAR